MKLSTRQFASLYRAFLRKDARLDGRVFIAVRTTGIYCLLSCRARTPRPENVTFYRSRAEVERDGFRPCRKCRPEVRGGQRALELALALLIQAQRVQDLVDRQVRRKTPTLAEEVTDEAAHLKEREDLSAVQGKHVLHCASTRFIDDEQPSFTTASHGDPVSVRCVHAGVQRTLCTLCRAASIYRDVLGLASHYHTSSV